MQLAYLDFDFAEGHAGEGSFDAMAAVGPAQLAPLEAELLAVLDWASRHFGPPAPLEEGGEWDVELQGVRELATALQVQWTPGARTLAWQEGATAPPRTTLSVTLTGTAAFCDAFRQAFAA